MVDTLAVVARSGCGSRRSSRSLVAREPFARSPCMLLCLLPASTASAGLSELRCFVMLKLVVK